MTNITLVTFLSKTLELLKLETLRPSSLFSLFCRPVKITSSAISTPVVLIRCKKMLDYRNHAIKKPNVRIIDDVFNVDVMKKSL
jgi:hypothetical protein